MPFQVNGQSMYESYYDREFIIVDRLTQRDIPLVGAIKDVQRGDVVVFKPGVSEDRKYFIKRIIGIPGDSVKISGGNVYIREQGGEDYIELDESEYLSERNNNNTTVLGSKDEFVYEVPDGEYFVMGDNRTHSTDSRTCFSSCSLATHFVPHDEITGRVFMDLGYFNLKHFSFVQPELGISTTPRFFDSHATHEYGF